MTPDGRTPATVVTGFLGSGKTTVISHLVEYLVANGEKPAYIKNELGEADLDAQLLRGQNIQARELLNGCICCTLVGPFISAIDELLSTYKPDRLIIESAGTADPASLALMVSQHPRLYRDGVISIIDVVNFDGYEDINMVARRQAELTDLIVFNKVELVSIERKRAVVGYVRELNEKAPIVEAPLGYLNPRVAFGLDSHVAWGEMSKTLDPHDHHHTTEDHIQAKVWRSDKVYELDKFLAVLQRLPQTVFRVKGFLQTPAGRKVINGVFKRFDVFDPPGRGASQSLNFASDEEQGTELILIGYQIEQNFEEVVSVLNSSLSDS